MNRTAREIANSPEGRAYLKEHGPHLKVVGQIIKRELAERDAVIDTLLDIIGEIESDVRTLKSQIGVRSVS